MPSRRKQTLRMIPLGGVNEIGKNMTAYQYADQILVVDCGLMFPEEDMLGVDLVIPDISFLLQNASKILGIVLTHAHEDHIGALPFVLKQLNVPLWGTALTLGMVGGKLEEAGLHEKVTTNTVKHGEVVAIGDFKIRFIHVCHSVPDAVSLGIETPAGTIVHTSDFKFDLNPIDGRLTDVAGLAKLGEAGVLALVTDCTNVEKSGSVASERVVGATFDEIFKTAKGRIIITSFASNLHRVQQAFDVSVRYDRKVILVGRSMVNNVDIAMKLGYLKVPSGTIAAIQDLDRLHPIETTILCTGSQGEPMSALTRIAVDEHKKVSIAPGDVVIISASPIPGNEDLVNRTINHLFRRGARVIYDAIATVHVSGHANQEDLKMMLNLTQPKWVIPVHGEARHIFTYAAMAAEMGYWDHVRTPEIGEVLEFKDGTAEIVETVTSGSVLVDGIGLGDVDDVVLRDRSHLSQDGILVVVVSIDKETGEVLAGPEVISRGFVYEQEAELLEDAKEKVLEVLADLPKDGSLEWSAIKADVRRALNKFVATKTGRRPMVMPVIQEI